jgi:hypothetical protein
MDHYHHPDFDNYLLHQTHYYHSLNAFPKGAKFHKDLGMRGMMMKKNNFNDALARQDISGGLIPRYGPQTNSDKTVKTKKKRNNSGDIVMLYHPSIKKGYPQLKSVFANNKTTSAAESSQQTGRKRRANSQ